MRRLQFGRSSNVDGEGEESALPLRHQVQAPSFPSMHTDFLF